MAKIKNISDWNYKDKINIGEHLIDLPSLPKDLSKVYFIDEDSENAFWDRKKLIKLYPKVWLDFIPGYTKINQEATLPDKDGLLGSISKEDTLLVTKTYEEEIDRRTNGVFIKNGKEIIWIPGDMWFVLMWCKTKRPDKKGDYFDFREFQRDFFILVWYCNLSELILGLFLSKPKKTGITNLMWLCFLNWATMTKNNNYGAMNITQDKGAKTFRDHFMYAYHGLPMVMKPSVKSKSEPDGIIVFGKQYRNSSKAKIIMNEAVDELNTTVMCVPTALNAFDVDVFSAIYYDEPPKYLQDFGEIYRSNSAGTSLQDFSVGKIFLTSYTPEDNSASFMAAKELFYDSELRTITPNSGGKTKSKLICYHIPAYQSWWTSFDKYGRCNEQDAMKKIMDGRAQSKDRPRELQALKRRFANDKREAWSIGGSGSVLDAARLSNLLSEVEKDQRESPEPLFQEGKLEWKNKLWEMGLKNKRPKGQFCEVEFIPLTDEERMNDERGRLRIYQDIPKNLQNLALKQGRDEFGFLLPPPIFMNVLGGDPTQHAAASEVIEGSKNAYICLNRRDDRIDAMYGKVMTGVINFVYFFRPELPDEAYEDLLKLIIYTGALSTIEANVPEMATRLMNEGLGHYLLVKDENGIYTIWKPHMGLPNDPEKKYHFIRTTSNSQENKDRLEWFIKLMKRYIQKPPEGEKSYGETIGDERILEQWMKIDIKDTKLLDLFMASGYALITDDIYSTLLLIPDENKEDQQGLLYVLRALKAG